MMTLTKLLLLLMTVVVALAAVSFSAVGEANDFIIENADGTRTISLSTSTMFDNYIGAVLPRILIEFADGNRTREITAPSAALAALTNNLAPRIVIEFADNNAVRSMTYPQGLIGDTTPPQQNNPGVTSGGSGVTFSWQTNEPAKGAVKYGFQPGALDQTLSETLFATQHALTITGLNPGQTVYYRLISVDRSGNTAQSNEQSYNVAQGSKLFLPSVIK